MTSRQLTKLVERDDWYWKRTSGSHRVYKHPTKTGTVVISYHGAKDVPPGTLKSILKQAELEWAMLGYTVIFEQGKDGGWGAYAPDLPGLGAAAETREEVNLLIREGIVIYLEELRADGQPIPVPVSHAELIHVQAA